MHLKERQNCMIYALLKAAHESIGLAIESIENYNPAIEFEPIAMLFEAEKAVAKAKAEFQNKTDDCTYWEGGKE